MSKTQRPPPRHSPNRRNHGPLSGASRAQLAFAVISSLVICAMIGGVFVSVSFSDAFGGLFTDDASDRENYVDPNSDIISEQQTIVAENPDDLEDVLLLANLLGNSNRLGDAIPLYERALEMAPEDINARVSFARALADGGMHADAELQFQRTLEMEPDNQPAHYYLAELYTGWSPVRTADALTHYRRAAEIDPGTLIGERSQTQLDTMGAGTPAATPAVDGSTPVAAP